LRPHLVGPVSADVCIVGAGLTGLWTAYYLKRADPSLAIVVVEQRYAGFGASGRNGGWLSATVPGSLERYRAARGVDAARDLQREMIDAVDEVIRATREERIDADVVKGGTLRVAHTPAQLHRIAEAAATATWWGDAHTILAAPETRARVNVAGVLGSTYSPNGARLHPGKLIRGLAEAVTRAGVTLYESTSATAIGPRRVETPLGTVDAEFVVRATEGFTASLPGLRRRWLPMNSSMIVTEPIDESTWAEIGWEGGETLGDSAHAFMYAQRTADNRIAIGGRGVPYRFGSRLDVDGETSPATVYQLQRIVARLFPTTSGVGIDHAWSGVLGVPRDWCATVEFDSATGVAAAGGYAGHGVTAANLAAQTLRDLVLRRDSTLVHLPWVNWSSRDWESEPLRWCGVRGLYLAYRAADRAEASGRETTSRWALVADRLSGR
jgi:glycine/D-amino acid oxidase-like deaminating enzyme